MCSKTNKNKLQDGGGLEFLNLVNSIVILISLWTKKESKNRKMASSSFSDAPVPEDLEADAKSVTIVINDNGEINYDEKTLQSIIGEILFFTFLTGVQLVFQ